MWNMEGMYRGVRVGALKQSEARLMAKRDWRIEPIFLYVLVMCDSTVRKLSKGLVIFKLVANLSTSCMQ